MSAGARKRMEVENEQMMKEENLRNASGFLRTAQVVGIFMTVLWLSGTLRASAWEPDDDEVDIEAT